jgi:hypothetical protein
MGDETSVAPVLDVREVGAMPKVDVTRRYSAGQRPPMRQHREAWPSRGGSIPIRTSPPMPRAMSPGHGRPATLRARRLPPAHDRSSLDAINERP